MSDGRDGPFPTPAPRVRQMLAGALDMAVAGGTAWLHRRRGGAAPAGEPAIWMRLLGPLSELVREQIGSPGERLVSLRRVDERTGRRVQLWRTLLVVATQAAGAELGRRLRRPDPERERERAAFNLELRAIDDRHGNDPGTHQAEIARLFERAPEPATADLMRSVGSVVAVGLLVRLVRRRLAPTVVIDARPRRDHSP
jgi:hypothetical protein